MARRELACIHASLRADCRPLERQTALPGSVASDCLPICSMAFLSYLGNAGALQPSPEEVSRALQDAGRPPPHPALQYSADVANKAGLFVFRVSSKMSWQLCDNTEE